MKHHNHANHQLRKHHSAHHSLKNLKAFGKGIEKQAKAVGREVTHDIKVFEHEAKGLFTSFSAPIFIGGAVALFVLANRK